MKSSFPGEPRWVIAFSNFRSGPYLNLTIGFCLLGGRPTSVLRNVWIRLPIDCGLCRARIPYPCCSLRIAAKRANRIKTPIANRTGLDVEVVVAPAKIMPINNMRKILRIMSSLPFLLTSCSISQASNPDMYFSSQSIYALSLRIYGIDRKSDAFCFVLN
jgi:hypothetical protein